MYVLAAKGAIGNCQRITLYNPIFSIIPDKSIVPMVGAFWYTFACHVWKGMIGILIAYAKKNAKKIHVCSVAVKFSLYKSSNKKLPALVYKYAKAISINNEPPKV